MSDAFWAALFTAAPILLGIYLAHIRQMKNINANTVVTVAGQQAVYDKIDSAEKKVTEQVTATGSEVKTEAINTALASSTIAKRTATEARDASNEVLQQLAPIVEKMNGGPGGFTQLTERLASLENKYGILVQGQIDLTKSIDHLVEIIARKQY